MRNPALHRSTWRVRLTAAACAAALAWPALVAPAFAQNRLPALGDPASEDFSIATEHKLGEAIMREIHADPDYLDDPILLEYVESLWQPLVAQARIRGNLTDDIEGRLAWEPFLIRDTQVNAFALPGGYVGVYLGMMAMTSTRDELASVLAHEMSHITQRHIARSIGNSRRQSILSLATLLVGILAASKAGTSSIDAANAAVVGSQALAIQGQLNFSRDMEREADRVGFSVMSGAGFAPGGMASMFEKLETSSRLNDAGGYPYLRSHPLTSERIGEAKARMGTAPPAAPVSVLEHTAAQARARVLMDTRFEALRRWQALDGDRGAVTPSDRLLNAYESGLASTYLRDWARADASIASAIDIVQRAPGPLDRRALRAVGLMKVQSLLARGDVAGADVALLPFANDPSRPVLLLAAQAALARKPGSPDEAAALKQRAGELQTWVAIRPRDSLAWTALGQIEERLGEPLRAVRADAESRVALGDFTGAIDRLHAGQRRARTGGEPVDFIDVSVIDARLRDVQALQRQEKEDEKALR